MFKSCQPSNRRVRGYEFEKEMSIWVSWTKIYLMIVLPMAHSKINHEWNVPATITYKPCEKMICKQQAEDIIACMKQNVNPCEDFFEYVCGNWTQTHIDPNKQYRVFPWNVESTLEYKAYMDIRQSLEQPIDPHEDEYETKAKMLYKACMKLPWMGKMNAADMKPIVSHAGSWPMFPLERDDDKSPLDWVSIHDYYLKLTGESALFGLALKPNPTDKLPTLEIRKLLSPYGGFTRLAYWTIKETNGYVKFLSAIAQDVKPPSAINIPSNMFHKHIENVFDFRNKIQTIINGLGKPDRTVMTIDYLNAWYNDKSAIHRAAAKIPWLKVIQTLYENNANAEIDEKTVILISYTPYLLELRSLLDKMPSRTIINHIHLYFIERHLRLTKEQEELYYASRSLSPLEPVAKNRVFPEKWFGCIEKHAMPDTLGRMYVENHSSLMMIEHVQKLIKGVQDMVMVQINDAPWLDEQTKLASKRKVGFIKKSIGYPKWYNRPSKRPPSSTVGILPQHPEAKYVLNKNKIYLTAAYFQTPMYNVYLPDNINYASLGSLVGHEIYHSLDTKGIWYNAEGKKMAWWPTNMIATYNIKRGCFRKQYSRYKVIEFKGYKDAPRKSYSYDTTGEDISDTMGLKAAYEAYRLRLYGKNYVCDSLPQLSSYSCDAMFFISFARTFCFAATPRQMMFAARYDEHNSPRIRVNGAVSNMKEFSDAFECEANAPLNPKRRCDLWEK